MINKNSTLMLILSALSIASSSFSMETNSQPTTNSEAHKFVYQYVKPEWIKKCSYQGIYPFFDGRRRHQELYVGSEKTSQETGKAQEELKQLSDQNKLSTHQLSIIKTENEAMDRIWRRRYKYSRKDIDVISRHIIASSAGLIAGIVFAMAPIDEVTTMQKMFVSGIFVGGSSAVLSLAIPSFYNSWKTMNSSLKLMKHHQDINETVSGILLNRKQ